MQINTSIPASGSQARHHILDESHDSIILLLKDAEASLPGDHNSARLYLTRALTMLRRTETLSKPDLGRLLTWQITRLMSYIDNHIEARIRTIELANVLNISVSHFSHVFKNTFGMTPLVYVARRRIESACQIMLTTDSSLTEIAFSHGFCDQSHFIRTFRRHTGMAPQAWRRLRRLELHEDQAAHPAFAKNYG